MATRTPSSSWKDENKINTRGPIRPILSPIDQNKLPSDASVGQCMLLKDGKMKQSLAVEISTQKVLEIKMEKIMNEVKRGLKEELRREFDELFKEQQATFDERFKNQQAAFDEQFKNQQVAFDERFKNQQATFDERFKNQDELLKKEKATQQVLIEEIQRMQQQLAQIGAVEILADWVVNRLPQRSQQQQLDYQRLVGRVTLYAHTIVRLLMFNAIQPPTGVNMIRVRQDAEGRQRPRRQRITRQLRARNHANAHGVNVQLPLAPAGGQQLQRPAGTPTNAHGGNVQHPPAPAGGQQLQRPAGTPTNAHGGNVQHPPAPTGGQQFQRPAGTSTNAHGGNIQHPPAPTGGQQFQRPAGTPANDRGGNAQRAIALGRGQARQLVAWVRQLVAGRRQRQARTTGTDHGGGAQRGGRP